MDLYIAIWGFLFLSIQLQTNTNSYTDNAENAFNQSRLNAFLINIIENHYMRIEGNILKTLIIPDKNKNFSYYNNYLRISLCRDD